MDRPTQALQMIARGRSIDQAADDMSISRSSIEKFLMTIRKRLNARNTANAIYIAAKAGLICIACFNVNFADVDAQRRSVRPARRDQYESAFIIEVGGG
jgi:DNA-binding CsgD family transcriptional regulator